MWLLVLLQYAAVGCGHVACGNKTGKNKIGKVMRTLKSSFAVCAMVLTINNINRNYINIHTPSVYTCLVLGMDR